MGIALRSISLPALPRKLRAFGREWYDHRTYGIIGAFLQVRSFGERLLDDGARDHDGK